MNAVLNLGTRINRSLGRYSLLAMTCGILLGATGDYPWLKRLIPIALFLMLYPAMLDVEIGKIKEGIANPTLLTMALAMNFCVAPLVMFGMVHLYKLDADPWVLVGITLFGIVPCGGMVPAYTGMLRGNVSLSVAITAVSLLLSSHLLGRVAGSTYEDGVALTVSTTAKNTAVAIALAASVFPPEVALVIGVAGPLVQLPVMLTYLKWKTVRKAVSSFHQ